MVKKYPCAMDGCDESTDSGLFKIEEKKSYIIPLCEEHFHDLVVLRSGSSKKTFMVIDYKKLPMIEIR